MSCLEQFLAVNISPQEAPNDLIGLKRSPWVVLGLVKIWSWAGLGKKSNGLSKMTLGPEKSEIFENFQNYFFEFSRKPKLWCTIVIWNHLSSLMAI